MRIVIETFFVDDWYVRVDWCYTMRHRRVEHRIYGREMSYLTSTGLRGAAVLNVLALTQLALRMISFVWLTRMLEPEEFGLAAIAITIVLMAGALNDAGMSSALVRRSWPARTMTLTVFWGQVFIGMSLALIILAAAPIIGWVFGRADAVPLIRLATLALLANGMAAVPWTMLQREGRFMTIAGAEMVAGLVSLVIAVTLASLGAGAYAALSLFVAPSVIRAALLMSVSGLRPVWRFSRRALGSILPYSVNLLGEQLISMISQQMDRTIIGIRLGASPLGVYHQAGQIFVLPLQLLAWGSTTALFPVFSKMQQEPNRLAEAYLFATRAFVAVAFPAYAGLAFVAEPAIVVMLGDAAKRWDLVAPTLSILCLGGLSVSAGSFNGIFLQALGQSRTLFRYAVVSLILLIVCVMIGVQWGLLGAAAGYAVAVTLGTGLFTRAVLAAAGISGARWFRAVNRPALATLAMVMALMAARLWLHDLPHRDLPILIALGVGSYAVGILVIDPELCRKIWNMRLNSRAPMR